MKAIDVLWACVIGMAGLIAFDAQAQNVPTAPKGCFVIEGKSECYSKSVDCGNSYRDVDAYAKLQGFARGFDYLEALYGYTTAVTCSFLLSAEEEAFSLEDRLYRIRRKLRRCRRG